ncbi:MAG: type III pantothenate kinase [Candidatus Omnitrophica bacterium]|nr:type III pantothenate kinase [Candidatus Omnitrophota bacterium]
MKESHTRKDMVLAIDIGNTHVSMAMMRGNKSFGVRFVSSQLSATRLKKDVRLEITRLERQKFFYSRVLICSVVPMLTSIVCAVVKQTGASVSVVGQDVLVPIRNSYHVPGQVGMDRLVISYAAKYFYGCPCAVIDFGTALTVDIISRQGAYEGGLIVPGLRLAADSLAEHTALLPRIGDFTVPRAIIGRDTHNSIMIGLVWGYRSMIEGLIRRLRKRLRSDDLKIIATGGHADLLQYQQSPVDTVDKNLIFKGLSLLSRK